MAVINLLSANFFSMIRSKRFWLGTFIMAAGGVYMVLDINRMKDMAEFDGLLDSGVFQYATLLFLILPALGSLFINTDYNDGTIRNKLTVGRTRTQVYLSNLITVYAAGVFYTLVYEAVYLLVGFPVLGSLRHPQAALSKLLMMLLLFLALSALFTLLATLITNRSVLLICVFMAFGLILGAQIINAKLEAPEMIEDYGGVTYITTEDGNMTVQYMDKNGNPIDPEDIPRVPNPRYVAEPIRTVLRKVNDIQPGGQLAEFLEDGHLEPDGFKTATPYWQLALYAAGLAAAVTAGGLIFFRRKDLK